MLGRSDGLTEEQFNAKKANSSMSAECSLTVAKRVNSHGQGRQEPGVFAYTVDKVDGPGWLRYDLKIRVSPVRSWSRPLRTYLPANGLRLTRIVARIAFLNAVTKSVTKRFLRRQVNCCAQRCALPESMLSGEETVP